MCPCMDQYPARGPSLVHIGACCLFGAKPLSESIISYRELDPWRKMSVNSISTIQQIGKPGRWQRLPGIGRPEKTTTRDERYLGRLVKPIRFHSLAQVTQEFVTHLEHPVFKRTVQRRLHGQVIYSHVAVQISDISRKNLLQRRRCITTLNQTTGPA